MTDSRAVSTVMVTLGRCDEMRAEVLAGPAAGGTVARITGTLTGPRRGRDTTLPSTARFQPTATAGVSRAILTEPAYWTPDLPNLYRLEAAIEAAAAPPQAIDRLVGLRHLGVRGRSLWLDGHRWVPRAVAAAGVAGIDACKPATLAAVVAEPDETVLARADEIGVAVLALVTGSSTADPALVVHRIAAWSAHPSAVVAILPQELHAATVAAVGQAALPHKGTLLLAATVKGAAPPPATIPAGIDALVVVLDRDALPHDAWRAGTAVPVIAWRRATTSPATGRAPCDALQAALAGWGANDRDRQPWDWAGYVVG